MINSINANKRPCFIRLDLPFLKEKDYPLGFCEKFNMQTNDPKILRLIINLETARLCGWTGVFERCEFTQPISDDINFSYLNKYFDVIEDYTEPPPINFSNNMIRLVIDGRKIANWSEIFNKGSIHV